jgi:3-deoxy-D-manno-octulosonate 8-phosphate phosphatase (KDO 8-P phosphatase)
MVQTTGHFKGTFIAPPEQIAGKLYGIKAFVFDWDGVFNAGWKDEQGSSPFNEVDSMGTNMLRFNHYIRNGSNPVAAIITGERNKAALAFAQREHFQSVYCGIKFKADALKHLCIAHNLELHEVAFMFDDVLDFSAAALCGLRIMVNRACNPLLIDHALQNGLVDYLTEGDGAHYAVRETTELLTSLSGVFTETMNGRSSFTQQYQDYFYQRNAQQTLLYTVDKNQIIPIDSL